MHACIHIYISCYDIPIIFFRRYIPIVVGLYTQQFDTWHYMSGKYTTEHRSDPMDLPHPLPRFFMVQFQVKSHEDSMFDGDIQKKATKKPNGMVKFS